MDFIVIIAMDFLDANTGYGGCCNNIWFTANGQIHKWDFDLPTSTREIINSKLITVIPNPATSFLRIELNEVFHQDEIFLEINSLNGQKLFQKKYLNSSELDLPISFLPNGMYTIHIFDDEQSLTKKFVKE